MRQPEDNDTNSPTEGGLTFDFLHETPRTAKLVDLLIETRRSQGFVHQRNLFTPEPEDSKLRKLLFALSALLPRDGLYNRFKMVVDGKERDFSVPCDVLELFCSEYLIPLIKSQKPHPSCHGAEPGWTPRRSLETHLPVSCALSLDMKSAFPSVPYHNVYNFYYQLSGDRDIAGFLAAISTVQYEKKRGLPQGANFSPSLFNRLLRGMDEAIFQAAKHRRMGYSRWVDDVAITSPDCRGIECFLGAVELVSRYMPVSPTKTYYQGEGDIFLLGHIIVGGSVVRKNSKEEREMKKSSPIDVDSLVRGGRRYELWI